MPGITERGVWGGGGGLNSPPPPPNYGPNFSTFAPNLWLVGLFDPPPPPPKHPPIPGIQHFIPKDDKMSSRKDSILMTLSARLGFSTAPTALMTQEQDKSRTPFGRGTFSVTARDLSGVSKARTRPTPPIARTHFGWFSFNPGAGLAPNLSSVFPHFGAKIELKLSMIFVCFGLKSRQILVGFPCFGPKCTKIVSF